MAEPDREQDRAWSALMAAAQDGDGQAYERLLRACAPFVRALARRSIADADRIEDVVQETLLTMHRVRQTYDPRRPFQPWLAAIASRRTIDALRRRGRIGAHETADERAYETFADPAANKQLDAHAASEEARALLDALSPAQRQALELVKVQELSLAEASAASGQSVGALKVNVHRALKVLRARWPGGGR
jgi:RNA polymerase sigma-70 factor (ECF subfamily)